MPISPRRLFLLGFVALIGLGFVLLFYTGQTTDGPSSTWVDHLFIATSAISTTGLSTLTITEAYSTWGLVVILVLFQIGGLGYLVLAGLIALPAGEASDYGQNVVETGSYVPESLDTQRFLKVVLAYAAICELIGTLVLGFGFRQNGLSWGDSLWHGLFHSISAFCTAGFSFQSDSLQGFESNTLIPWTILILAILGAVGGMFVVGIDARRRNGKGFSPMVRAVLWSFALVFVGFAVLFAFTSQEVHASLHPVLHALFLSGTAITGAGFSTLSTGALGLGVLTALSLPMSFGAAPTGTGGGIKLSNLAIAAVILRSQGAASDAAPKLFGEEVEKSTIRQSMGAVILYALFMAVGVVAAFYIAQTDIVPTDLAFEVISALGTVGLSRGLTADLTEGLKLLLVALMFAGRVGVLTLAMGLMRAK